MKRRMSMAAMAAVVGIWGAGIVLAQAFNDSFDAYSDGSLISAQAGWENWPGSSGAESYVSSAQAFSPPHSLDIKNDSDTVHQFTAVTSGQWVVRTMQYVPSSPTHHWSSYFILLSRYPYNMRWNTQVSFNTLYGLVTGYGGESLPLITDQWVEIRVEIDLTADSQSFYYGGQLLYQASWTNHVNASTPLELQALDLWAGGTPSIYYDDVCVDMDSDGDGVPNACDICPGFDDHVDTDADGVPDGCDVCPGFDDNLDTDGDGVPNGCDICDGANDNIDADSDGVPDGCDICPGHDDFADADEDGVPDGCDDCPYDPDNDVDGDGICGDVDTCPNDPDNDIDGDGICGDVDACPNDPDNDIDGDGVCGDVDNCPDVFNPDQADSDQDGIGDACENQPPQISCIDPVVLWSPDHELVDVSSAFTVSDPDDDPVTLSFRVISDESEVPDTGDGTGRHAPDFKTQLACGDEGPFVRSERRGPEDGRFYIFVITADDGNGGVTTEVCVAAVCPHDQDDESLANVMDQANAAAAEIGNVADELAAGVPGDPLPDTISYFYEHAISEELGPKQ